MAHQLHLEKKKYRQWVKGGLGLVYLREGLAPFCDDIARQQHRDILDKIKQTKNLSTVTCGQCTLANLKPDHVKQGNRQCPLHQPNCNCWYPSGKQPCPHKVCDAIYDVIVTNHGSFKPFWENTDISQWCSDPWSIAKCFISVLGYENKTSAADTDCTGLLRLIINNSGFHDHIQNDLNVFSKVIEHRNEIFHSSSMELEENTVNTYIQNMIAVLQDGKELCQRQDAQDAVTKLQELMNEDFIITTRNEADVVHASIESIKDTIHELEDKLREKLKNVPSTDDFGGLETELEELGSHMNTRVTILEKDTTSVDTRVTSLEKGMTSMEMRVSGLEKDMELVKEDVKKLKSALSSQQKQYDYVKAKLEFQEKLIKLYRGSLLQVSAIPLQPERNQCNFSEVYIRPKITYETKHGDGKKEEIEIKSIADIFTIDGVAQTSIYVLGDAGGGKSSFCKCLVDYWCLERDEGRKVKDEFSGVNEMKKFDFLFYISLRHCKDDNTIQEMLQKRYKSKILSTLLDEESAKILIVLDGLDEWCPKSMPLSEFQTEGLPERDVNMDYTIITTSRPWKIETLGITDREMQQRLTLKGFNKSSVKEMIYKLVPILNKSFGKNKSSSDCEQKFENKSLECVKQVPIMLVQLICLWFDDKLHKTSRCAIYTGMLELYFSWNDKKRIGLDLFEEMRKMSEGIQGVELPRYLNDSKICKAHKYLIHGIASLAYETLFKNTKEASLTFDSSIFEQLEISDDIKIACLRLGILSEDKCPSLSASTGQSTVLSFVHKSVQEYLAAVYIATMFRAKFELSTDWENADLSDPCTQFIEMYFSTCATLDTVLEREIVIIMLCGLEPRIAASIFKYIYDIGNRDAHLLECRRIISDEYRHMDVITRVQQCIQNSVKELQACQTHSQFNFYLGDVIIRKYVYDDDVRADFFEQYILPDSVRQCTIDYFHVRKEEIPEVQGYVQKCQRLEKLAYSLKFYKDDDFAESFRNIIDRNVSTLKSVSVNHNSDLSSLCNIIIRHLPDMKHLVALKLAAAIVTHADFASLCTFLSGTSHLEQISIDIRCKCGNQHEVDLSKYQKLQCLQYSSSVIVTCANTSYLEIFKHHSLNNTNCVRISEVLSTAVKLSKLSLQSAPSLYHEDFSSGIIASVHSAITDKLMSLLPLLHSLHELRLSWFTLTDNIIKSPSEMKSMKLIELSGARMSLTTWRTFVDSLPFIPQAVRVEALGMCITRDEDDCNPNIMSWRTGGKETAAFQYVREKDQLFIVHDEWSDAMRFSTRTQNRGHILYKRT